MTADEQQKILRALVTEMRRVGDALELVTWRAKSTGKLSAVALLVADPAIAAELTTRLEALVSEQQLAERS